jgi:3-dehydroquinate synthase
MIINIKSSIQSYPLIIENNSLKRLSSLFSLTAKRALIVTDDNIPQCYIDDVSSNFEDPSVLVLPHGEETKSIDSFLKIQDKLLELEYSRHDYLIALGGGVIGDLVGYAASSYKRGIPFINIPTSSLSMIDSSIGGKTAINYKHYKNVIGAFYPPVGVLIDYSLLKSLPKRQLNNGLVEALKAGYIYDSSLLDEFKKDVLDIETIITKSILVKQYFVENDEKEQGIRKILNYGHTIGHALESIYGFSDTLYHGEAVGIGMMFINDNPMEVISFLKKLDIHFDQKLDVDQIMSYIKNDKKMNNGYVDLIKVRPGGQGYIEPTTLDSLKETLEKELDYVRYLR